MSCWKFGSLGRKTAFFLHAVIVVFVALQKSHLLEKFDINLNRFHMHFFVAHFGILNPVMCISLQKCFKLLLADVARYYLPYHIVIVISFMSCQSPNLVNAGLDFLFLMGMSFLRFEVVEKSLAEVFRHVFGVAFLHFGLPFRLAEQTAFFWVGLIGWVVARIGGILGRKDLGLVFTTALIAGILLATRGR